MLIVIIYIQDELEIKYKMDKKLNPIMSSLNEIKLNMNHVEDSVAFLGNKYNDLSVQMKEIKSKIKPTEE